MVGEQLLIVGGVALAGWLLSSFLLSKFKHKHSILFEEGDDTLTVASKVASITVQIMQVKIESVVSGGGSKVCKGDESDEDDEIEF